MTKTFGEQGFPGRLIAVEGVDGSGKSTQIYLLKRWLEIQGCKVHHIQIHEHINTIRDKANKCLV